MGSLLRSGSRVNDASPPASALRVQSSVQGQPLSFLHGQQRIAGNLIWYGDFSYTSGSGSGKGGKGGAVGGGGKGATGQGTTYSASFMLGLCEGPIDVVTYLWNNKTPESISSQGFAVFDGYQGQPAWGFLSGPEALGYSSLAYTAAANYSLGNQPELPNFNFEVRGAISGAVTETYTISSGSSYQYTATYFSLLNSTTESITIPPTPYQYQAQNANALTALPVILGNITVASGQEIIPTPNSGVVDLNGTVFTFVNGTPGATNEYTVNADGLYTFYSSDAGRQVIIIDLAVSPGVSYVYQPTATFSANTQTLTLSSTTNLAAGQLVTGAGIAPGTVINSVGSGTIVISQATTAPGSSETITCWGQPLVQVGNGASSPGSTNSTFVGSADPTNGRIIESTGGNYNSSFPPAGIAVGQTITGTAIPSNTTITSITGSGNTIYIYLSNGPSSNTSNDTYTYATNSTVTNSLEQGQFSVGVANGAYGQYTFSSADAGKTVGIIDVVDADPSLSLTDYLTNPRYGIGFPSAYLGNLSALQTYTFANGLFISPAFVQQQSGQDFFNDFSTGLNGEFVWSTGLLTWQPYGDTSVSAYGYTYTPPADPIYSLDDDDFLKNEGTASVGVSAFSTEDPVVCVRKRQSDAYNDVKVEYLDRGNSYNPAIVEAQDDASINTFGLRPADTKTLHFFTGIQSALTSAQLQLGRQMIRNQYTFTVPWYYILLDPMDIVAITDANLGLDDQWVRILEITENQQDSTLTITAEEYLTGTGSSPEYGSQVKAGFAPNYNVDPGQAIALVVFEAPVQIATNNGLEVWLLTGGGGNWGGADIYVSTDNQTYKLLGRYIGSSRLGVNNSDFPSGSDPDTTNTLQVTLSTPGELYSATSTTDADLGHTLCYEGGYPNPPAPTLSSSAGGSIPLTSYYVRTTYLFSGNEGPPSPEESITVPANSVLNVTSPGSQTGATAWNVYVGTSTGTETLQNSTPISIGAGWIEPTSGLISGTSPPPSETSYELVSYTSADPVTGSEYNLGTYIRRGMYGTTVSDHPAGSQFGRLDGSQFTFPYDKSQIGTNIYIKLLSFNLWGGGEYTLAEVQPFIHTIEGPPLPGTVQDFAATQVGNAVAFTWTDLTDYALKGYDILYGPTTGTVSTAIILTEAARATEMTNAAVPPGTWTFYIKGHDIADQLGPVSSLELTVTNSNDIISQVSEQPTWLATPALYVFHYTGNLVPVSTELSDSYAPINVIPTPTLTSTSGGSLPSTTYYVKVTYVDSTGETTPSSEASLAVSANNLLQVTAGIGSGPGINTPTGWNVYISTTSGAEVLQNATPIPTSAVWTIPTSGLITGVSPPTLNTTGWQVFDEFVPNPQGAAQYFTNEVDTGYNDNLRVFYSATTNLGPGQTGSPAQLIFSIDTWLTGQSDPGVYNPWTIGFIEMRYLRTKLNYSPIVAGNVSYLSAYTVTVDTAPLIENSSAGGINAIATISTTGNTHSTTTIDGIASMTGIAIGQAVTGSGIPAGTTVMTVNVPGSSITISQTATSTASGVSLAFNTWVTFPTQYHSDPNVVVTPVSSSASTGTSGSATNITTTGFSPLVWNGTTNIAGVVNWQSTGS